MHLKQFSVVRFSHLAVLPNSVFQEFTEFHGFPGPHSLSKDFPVLANLAPETRWANKYPWKPKQKARDGPLVAGANKFVSMWSDLDRICPSSLNGFSNETTIVIGLRKALFPSRHETTTTIDVGKAWFPTRQHSREMRFSIRATRGYFFPLGTSHLVTVTSKRQKITSGTQGKSWQMLY